MTTTTTRRRRLVLTLALAAGLGMDTTFFVAAWCVGMATTDDEQGSSAGFGTDTFLSIDRAEGFGKTLFKWAPDREIDPTYLRTLGESTPVPWWSTIHRRAEVDEPLGRAPEWIGNSGYMSTRWDMAFGWPWRACMGTMGSMTAGYPRLPYRTVTQGGAMVGLEQRVLPTMVLAPGFLADAALYGACWWVMLFAPASVRTWRRRRRTACLGCGYDRRGLGDAACPECGVREPGVQEAVA